MAAAEQEAISPGTAARPHWSAVLRALREARGVTLDGWGARLGVSRTTVQRWERGERAPDPGAEAGILAYCREQGLFRPFDRGPLAGRALTADALRDLLAERGVDPVVYAGWEAIDALERAAGEPQGRPRVKLVTWDDLLAAARGKAATAGRT